MKLGSILGKNAEKQKEEDSDEEEDKSNGVKIEYFIKTCQELKEKHPEVSRKILVSIGIPLSGKNPVIDWNTYLKIMSIIRYHTITKEQSLDFWGRFLNPNHLPNMEIDEIYRSIEYLARGSFTVGPTLISERFATGFIDMLKNKDCFTEVGKNQTKREVVDMRKFKLKIMRN